jgi:putative two-component system response regulator
MNWADATNVLIVDDDPIALELLAHALTSFGFRVEAASSGREALDCFRRGSFRIVVSDMEMPDINGTELCRQIRQRSRNGYTYFILLTSHSDSASVVEGLDAGADDYVCKPFQPTELRLRLQAGLRLLSLEGRDLMIFALAKLAESRDSDTGHHLERVREYCRELAESLATFPAYRDLIDGQYIELLYATSPLHDVGKVAIPDSILRKPGRLTAEEFAVMQRHTVIGGQTLQAAAETHPDARFMQMAMKVALSHHEKWDGSGYPYGLRGEQIPLCGRIMAVADVYDALTSKRVYKPAYSHDRSVEIICEGSGSHFDPQCVEAFLAIADRFDAIRRRLVDDANTTEEAQFQLPPPSPLLFISDFVDVSSPSLSASSD